MLMAGFGPTRFYVYYKEFYAEAIKLGKSIAEERNIRIKVLNGYRCPCGGEDCKYKNPKSIQFWLDSLVKERFRLVRVLEGLARGYQSALQEEYLESGSQKELQELAEIEFTLKIKETQQPEINTNAVQKV